MAFIGNTVQNQGFTPAIDYFNGNGVTVTFTLSRPIASVAQVIVAVDNVIQNPSSAFNVVGNSITFTSAPLSGTNNIWVEYTSLITTYQGISQDPTVIGDIRATGGYLAEGDFGNSFVDGAILDYVTGAGRVTVGELDDLIFYHGGTAGRSEMMRLSYAGNSTLAGGLAATGNITTTGSVGIGTSSPAFKTEIVGGATTVETTLLQVRSNAGGIGTGTTIALGNSTNTTAGSGRVELAAIRTTASGGSFVIRTGDDSGNIQERGRFDTSGNFLFNSGYGSVATAYGCRAWVNFDASSGTPSIRGSGNVSSITDNGVGDFTVNFTTSMPDVNYSAAITGNWGASAGAYADPNNAFAPYGQAPTTSALRVGTRSSNAFYDYAYVYVQVFR